MPQPEIITKKNLLNHNGKRPLLAEQQDRRPLDIFLTKLSKRSRTSLPSPLQTSSSLSRPNQSFLPPTPFLPRKPLAKPTTPTTLPPPPNPLGLVPDKESRLARERQRNKDELKRETLQWQEKYRVAIKSFVFYLDRLDHNVSLDLSNKLDSWGARVDQFFSKDVTHVITDIPVPANLPGPSPSAKNAWKRSNNNNIPYQLQQQPSPSSHNKENGLQLTRHKSNSVMVNKKSVDRANLLMTLSPEKHNAAEEDIEVVVDVPPIDSLIRKALEMKIKIWRTEKLLNVLSRLQDHRSPQKQVHHPLHQPHLTPKKPTLPSLLAREAQQGHTSERDPTSLRSDYHYFSSKSYYILVEDTNQEHKPIHIKEWPKLSNKVSSSTSSKEFVQQQQPPWPVLHGGCEGKSAFGKFPHRNSLAGIQTRIRLMCEERAREANKSNTVALTKPKACTTAIDTTSTNKTLLRRAKSMNILQRRQSTRLQLQQQQQTRRPLLAGAEPHTNQTALEHHRGPGKVFLAASGNSVAIDSGQAPSTQHRSSLPHPQKLRIDKRVAALGKRPTVNMALLAPPGLITSATGGKDKEMKRVQSLDAAMMQKEKLKEGVSNSRKKGSLGVRAKLGIGFDLLDLKAIACGDEPKPGYCENCRAKYADFKRHVIGKRHRRFALTEDNWWELDRLLERTERVFKPGVFIPPSLRKQAEEIEEEEGEEGEVYEEGEEDVPGEMDEEVEGAVGVDGTGEEGRGVEEEEHDEDKLVSKSEGEEDREEDVEGYEVHGSPLGDEVEDDDMHYGYYEE